MSEFKCGTFEPRPMEEIAEIVNRPHHAKCPCGWCARGRAEADANELRTALAKAEAERDALLSRLAPSLEYVEGVACGYGDDEIDRLTARLDSERARADRYLAAMTAYVDARIADGICIAQDGEPVPVAFERTELAIRALRAIVEEDRRG